MIYVDLLQQLTIFRIMEYVDIHSRTPHFPVHLRICLVHQFNIAKTDGAISRYTLSIPTVLSNSGTHLYMWPCYPTGLAGRRRLEEALTSVVFEQQSLQTFFEQNSRLYKY